MSLLNGYEEIWMGMTRLYQTHINIPFTRYFPENLAKTNKYIKEPLQFDNLFNNWQNVRAETKYSKIIS